MTRPFLFEKQFPADILPGPVDMAPPEDLGPGGGFSEADLEAVRDRAFRQGLEVGERDGFERGQDAARQAIEAQAGQALAAIETALHGAVADVAAFTERQERDAVRVVAALIAKLAPPLLDAVAEAEIDGLVLESLRAAVGRPHLEIRLPPASVERVRGQIEAVSGKAGFKGVVKLVGDPGLPTGTAAADWVAGGAERDPRALERQLNDAVAIAVSRLTVRGRDGR